MAVIPTPLSPREVSSPRSSNSMAATQQASLCAPLRCSPAPPCIPPKPSALLERRFKVNPSLNINSFQTSVGSGASGNQRASAWNAGAAAGAHSDRSGGASAFQAGVGTSASSIGKPATLYHVLEVPCTATENEIKTAYRRLAREHHPDRSPVESKEASTTKFLQIHNAYSTLSDARARAQYDLQLSLSSFGKPSPITFSSDYCSPRTPFSSGRGRNWETDQCWC